MPVQTTLNIQFSQLHADSKGADISGPVFKLNTRWTAALFLGCSMLVFSTTSWFKSPIQCTSHYPDKDFVNSYCWSTTSFNIPGMSNLSWTSLICLLRQVVTAVAYSYFSHFLSFSFHTSQGGLSLYVIEYSPLQICNYFGHIWSVHCWFFMDLSCA